MDIDELIGATLDQQPTRFANAFDAIVRQKIDARLEDESVAYAQQMFAEPEEIDDEESDDNFDEEDFDIDDEELEDDFDDEDFDLEDLDTEEEDDDGEDA